MSVASERTRALVASPSSGSSLSAGLTPNLGCLSEDHPPVALTVLSAAERMAAGARIAA